MILTGKRLQEASNRENGRIYALRSVTGEMMGSAPTDFSWDLIDRLIEKSYVFGRGSLVSVRHFQMNVELNEALKMLNVESGRILRERAMSPLDLLHRYCADRKTTTRKGEHVLRNGRLVYAVWFEHKANSSLRLAGERP